MPEEVTPATTEGAPATEGTAEGAPATATGAPSDSPLAAQAQGGPAAGPDLTILDSISPDLLMKHPRVAGIVGDRLHKEKSRWESHQRAETERQAAEAERTRLRELRKTDPVAYADEMEAREELEHKNREVSGVRESLARSIGAALSEMPEWSEMAAEDFSALQTALAGKGEEETLPTFVRAAVGLLGKRQAAKVIKTEVDKVLEREKQAWREQWEAERLTAEPSPDTRPGSRPPRRDPLKMSDEDFDTYYEKEFIPSITSRRRR